MHLASRKVAAFLGASAIIAAAYGSHGMKHKHEDWRKMFDSANKIHLAHAVAILCMSTSSIQSSIPTILMASGVLLFSGRYVFLINSQLSVNLHSKIKPKCAAVMPVH
jgi:uncharacterized membrane protein YgdD (TMEM256/DUF423 family)